jgi:hypothetical protein
LGASPDIWKETSKYNIKFNIQKQVPFPLLFPSFFFLANKYFRNRTLINKANSLAKIETETKYEVDNLVNMKFVLKFIHDVT